eukprot:GHVT01064970.1.p2 GENE.GHVT01064970.1~~GHVT01064970.1.p2  ORF type:complete len:165 (+),score=19.82 GHVT01064970.1:1967-2461(+)
MKDSGRFLGVYATEHKCKASSLPGVSVQPSRGLSPPRIQTPPPTTHSRSIQSAEKYRGLRSRFEDLERYMELTHVQSAAKKRIAEEANKQRQEVEQLACTFKPNVNTYTPPRPVAETTQVIPGVKRFMEFRDLARRNREDQRRREVQVFKIQPPPTDNLRDSTY